MGYTKDAIKGISWMSAFRIFSRLISFFKTAIIARVLNPSQFGIFGIASLVLELLEMLTETGINIIIIQSKDDIKEYINSAWVVSIVRGIAISLLILLTAGLISSFFNSANAYGILLIISVVPLVRGFINPAVISFQKDLKFQYEFIFRSSIFFFDAIITVIFVLVSHSAYSLAFGMLAGAILEVVLSFIFISPRPKLAFEKEYISEIFHRGKWITTFGIFNYFAQQGDNIVVGRLLGASSLGVYQMAYKISTLPISEVTDVVSKVVFPVYAKIEHDTKRLKRAFLKSTALISIATVVMGGIIYLFPKEIILLTLGDKWLSAQEVLQVLALYGVLRAVSGSASALFLAAKKQEYVTTMTFFRFVGLALTIYPFVRMYGIVGAGYSALLSVVIETPLIIYYIWKIFKTKNAQIAYEGGNIL